MDFDEDELELLYETDDYYKYIHLPSGSIIFVLKCYFNVVC